jgi:hypothetical protein
VEVDTIDQREGSSRECPFSGPDAKSLILNVWALDNENIITGAGDILRSQKAAK